MAIHVSLALSFVGSLALAFMLLAWAEEVAGARLLVVFLCGVALWIVGNELPSWLGPDAERPALMLLATAATTSAVFFHFATVFCAAEVPRAVLAGVYGLGLMATLASVVLPAGGFEPFAGVSRVAMPNEVGWGTSIVWAALAAAGQAVLLRALVRERGLARRQVAAVTVSSAWGLLCMSGYGIAALRLPIYPWPLLLLPAYPVILVYGILRYRVFVANAWARRALVWAMLTVLALLVVALVPLLPLEGMVGRLASGALVAAMCLGLTGPARRLAERLVYPGGSVSAEDLDGWRTVLSRAESPSELARHAGALLSRRLGRGRGHRRGRGGRACLARAVVPAHRGRMAHRPAGLGRGTARRAAPGRAVRRRAGRRGGPAGTGRAAGGAGTGTANAGPPGRAGPVGGGGCARRAQPVERHQHGGRGRRARHPAGNPHAG